MKHLLIIFSFLFLFSYQTIANTVIGKSIICKDKSSDHSLYAYFKSTNEFTNFYFNDYKIMVVDWKYDIDLKVINIYGRENYTIKRKDLSFYTKSRNGYCEVYNSKEELIEIMNNKIEQSKSQNKL